MASTCLPNFQYRTVYGSLIIELWLNHNLYHQSCTELRCFSQPKIKSKYPSTLIHFLPKRRKQKKEEKRKKKVERCGVQIGNDFTFHSPSSSRIETLEGKSTIVRNFLGAKVSKFEFESRFRSIPSELHGGIATPPRKSFHERRWERRRRTLDVLTSEGGRE